MLMGTLDTLLPVFLTIAQIVLSLYVCFNHQLNKLYLYLVLYGNILIGGINYMLLVRLIMDYLNSFFSSSHMRPFLVRLSEPLTGEMFILITLTLIIPGLYFKHVTLPLVRDANFLLNSLRKLERPKERKMSTPRNSFPME
jgi:hypothetical protein